MTKKSTLGSLCEMEIENEKRKMWQDRKASQTQKLSSSLIISTKLENKNKYRDDKKFRSHLSTPNEICAIRVFAQSYFGRQIFARKKNGNGKRT